MNRMVIITMVFGLLSCILSCDNSDNMPIPRARIEMQEYLDSSYQRKFRINKIEKNYSKDFIHEQTGFKVWLEDSFAIKFGPIYIEKNEVQGWTTYMGSNIEDEYKNAKQKK